MKDKTQLPDSLYHWEDQENKTTQSLKSKDYSIEAEQIESTINTFQEFNTFPDDFLILNDIYFNDVPTTGIRFESNSDAFVAETLRTSAPIISTEGREDFIVSISLVFRPGKPQRETLRRLLGEITRYPFIFVYNNRIKRALSLDESQTTIFALESGNLRNIPGAVGSVALDLTMHLFEYRPFSNHFYYNSYLAGSSKEKDVNTSSIDMPIKFGNFNGYESSEYSLSKYTDQVKKDVARTLGAVSTMSNNTPVIFPSDSDAWMHYANKLCSSELIPEVITDYPADYIGFSVDEFFYFSPPKESRQGTGNAAKFFGETEKRREWVYPWKVDSTGEEYSQTYQEQRTEAFVDIPSSLGNDKLATYQFRNKKMQIDNNTALWLGRMLLGENSSSYEVMASLLWAITNRWGYGRGNRSLYWWIRHFSQPVNQRWLPGGDKFEYWKKINPNHRRVSGKTVERRIRISNMSWDKLPKRVRKIVTEFRQGKVRIPSVWNKISNNLMTNWASYKNVDTKFPGGMWINGEWFFQDMYPKGRIIVTPPKDNSAPEEPISISRDQVVQKVEKKQEKIATSKTAEEKKKAEREYQESVDELRQFWIASLETQGFSYYREDPNIRNIFSRSISAAVSGNETAQRNLSVLPNVVCSGLSVAFGHRLAPIKIAGQRYNSYQFLGAGNKTGQIVLTFAGPEGKRSADLIKEIISKAKNNAQQFGSIIKTAGAIQLQNINYLTEEQNIILALFNIDSVIITRMQESNSSDAVDKYELILDFIVQDFMEESLEKRFTENLNNKREVIKRLLSLVEKQTLDIQETDKNTLVRHYTSEETEEVVYGAYGAEIKTNPRSYVDKFKTKKYKVVSYLPKGNKKSYPSWLADVLDRLAEYLTDFNKQLPPIDWKCIQAKKQEKWSQVYSDWGIDSLEGNASNVDYSVKGQIFGDSETDVIFQTDKEHQRLFNSWLDKMNLFSREIMGFSSDKENFSTYFGNLGEELLDSITSDLGSCYSDLLLPTIPGTDIPFQPEFYIYDDSNESPFLANMTNSANMQLLLERHVLEELESIQHYMKDAMLGGSYLSKNLPKILENRRIAINDMAGEFNFIDNYYDIISEGAYAWDPIYYRDDPSISNNSEVVQWKNKVASSLGGGSDDSQRAEFMNNLIALSSFNKDGRKWEVGSNGGVGVYSYTESDKSLLIETLYGDAWSKISFGPNPEYSAIDKTVESNIADLQEIKEEINKQSNQNWDPSENQTIAPEDKRISKFEKVDDSIPAIVNGDLSKELAGNRWATSEVDANARKQNALKTWGSEAYKAAEKVRERNETISVARAQIAHDNYGVSYSATGRALFGAKVAPQIEELQKKQEISKTIAKTAAATALGSMQDDLNMRRAFPTFKIYFIEDDSLTDTESVGGEVRRAFDDFYSTSAIQEIVVTRSRKIASDLAVIRMTNIGGNLFRTRFGQKDYEKTTFANSEKQGIYAETDKENPFEKLVLQDGVKVQIRLGYSGDPNGLESVFLGQIVEIQPVENGKIIEITCQGFGAELESVELGPLEDGPIFYSSQQVLSGSIIQDSVVNFGRQSKFNRFNPAEIRQAWTGGQGTGTLGNISPGQLISSWADSKLDKYFTEYTFLNYPQDDNIFAPPPSVYSTAWTRFWNNACIYRPLKQTPWQIFQEHELRHPGYISLAVPYGHSSRMTMFFGAKNQHYWKGPPSALEIYLSENYYNDVLRARGAINQYNYNDKDLINKIDQLANNSADLAKAVVRDIARSGKPNNGTLEIGKLFGRYVPFRNYHYIDSEHHIIKNEIRTSIDGTFNQIELMYFEDEDNLQDNEWNIISSDTEAEHLVENIEKMRREEDGFLTTKLDENIPESSIRSIREEYPSCVTLQMAKRYTQGLFGRYLRDAYKGEIIITGKEKLKPYDILKISDNTISMYGPVEVESVTHIFNADYGFVSIVTPDLCLDINDMFSAAAFDTACAAYSYTWDMTEKALGTSSKILEGFVGPFSFMGHFGMAKVASWTQDGDPVIANPLIFQGRPFLSNIINPKRASLFTSLGGKWTQYWDDLEDSWDKMDIGETFLDARLGVTEWFLELLGTDATGGVK